MADPVRRQARCLHFSRWPVGPSLDRRADTMAGVEMNQGWESLKELARPEEATAVVSPFAPRAFMWVPTTRQAACYGKAPISQIL